MPLHSQMLGRYPALQECLVRDAAHLTLGTRGPHVSAVQKLILLLDRAEIPLAELFGGVYGPGTAAAVLAYKRQRKIINFSYQTSADNIVGKMTIARLDQEALALERRGSGKCRGCRGNPGDVGPSREPAIAALAVTDRRRGSPPGPAREKPANLLGARVSIILQATTAADDFGGSVALMVNLMNRAAELMAPHGLAFSGGKLALSHLGPAVPDAEQVVYGSQASTFSVRAAAERVLPGRPNALRVIFCPFDEKSSDAFGVTDGGTAGKETFPRFCLINVRKAVADHGTLLHEMVHATAESMPCHDNECGGKDNSSVFAAPVGVPRDHLPARHAIALADSFFGFRGAMPELT